MSLRWNSGVNNWMVYGMGDVPVGNDNSSNLANLGIGHGAADGGAGYTDFDPKTGHELSVVTGSTYNLLNPSTGYQNGVDWHVDWGASQLSPSSCSSAPLAISFRDHPRQWRCCFPREPNEVTGRGYRPPNRIPFPSWANLQGIRISRAIGSSLLIS